MPPLSGVASKPRPVYFRNTPPRSAHSLLLPIRARRRRQRRTRSIRRTTGLLRAAQVIACRRRSTRSTRGKEYKKKRWGRKRKQGAVTAAAGCGDEIPVHLSYAKRSRRGDAEDGDAQHARTVATLQGNLTQPPRSRRRCHRPKAGRGKTRSDSAAYAPTSRTEPEPISSSRRRRFEAVITRITGAACGPKLVWPGLKENRRRAGRSVGGRGGMRGYGGNRTPRNRKKNHESMKLRKNIK